MLIKYYNNAKTRLELKITHTHTHTPMYFEDVIFQAFCVTFRVKVRSSLVLLADPQLHVSH